MSKWIVCTTAHEAYEFATEAEAIAFKNRTDGAFHMYELRTELRPDHSWGANSRPEICEYEYVKNDGYFIDWKGTCGNVLHMEMSFRGISSNKPKHNYCPHCGGKLIVKERL